MTRFSTLLATILLLGSGCTAAAVSGSDPYSQTEPGLDNPERDALQFVAETIDTVPTTEPAALDQRALIDDYIDRLEFLPVDDAQEEINSQSADYESGDYVCTTYNFSETEQYDKIVAYSANSESLWPGALIQGESVYSGLFTQAVLPRSPLTFSVSLNNIDGHVSSTMENPSLSAYREALAGILDASVTGSTAADMSVEIEEVHSEEQLSLALGVGFSYAGAELDVSFDYADTDIRSRYVVRYYQKYFTVDVDQPQRPSDFLSDEATIDDVSSELQPGDAATYVSSITYGRMILFTVESSFSSQEIGAALDFAYSGGAYDISADFSVGYREMLEESSITAYILGGSADEGAQAIAVGSYEALINLIGSGGNFGPDSPAAPIAYKLAYWKNNAPARFSLATDYDLEVCERINQGVQVTFNRIEVIDAGNDAWTGSNLELYGNVTAYGSEGSSAVLWNTNTSNDVQVSEDPGQNFYPQSGVINRMIVNAVPREGEEIIIDAYIKDEDSPGGDDVIGDTALRLDFSEGWRHEDLVIRMTGSDAEVNLYFSVRPI